MKLLLISAIFAIGFFAFHGECNTLGVPTPKPTPEPPGGNPLWWKWMKWMKETVKVN